MLTDKKIEKNYQKLLSTNEKFGFLSQEFIEQYGEELKTAGSVYSTHTEPGGAVLYALTVTKYSVMINSTLPKAKQFEEAEVIKLAIMSSLRMAVADTEFYQEEIDANHVYKFVSTNCPLNKDEFTFVANKLEFVRNIYALAHIIKQAQELVGIEFVLPEQKTEG